MEEQFVSTHDMGDGKYRGKKLLQEWVVVIDCKIIGFSIEKQKKIA